MKTRLRFGRRGKPTREQLHAEQRAAVPNEKGLSEWLGHDVCHVVEARDEEELDHALLDEVTNPVELNVNVFCTTMDDIVLGQRNAGDIILFDRCGRRLREAEVSE
jgi:hypothetical protein